MTQRLGWSRPACLVLEMPTVKWHFRWCQESSVEDVHEILFRDVLFGVVSNGWMAAGNVVPWRPGVDIHSWNLFHSPKLRLLLSHVLQRPNPFASWHCRWGSGECLFSPKGVLLQVFSASFRPGPSWVILCMGFPNNICYTRWFTNDLAFLYCMNLVLSWWYF